MKYYLADIIPRIKKYSATLDQSSFLIDKPWVVSSDKSSAYEKLIFRRDGRVHFSTNGDVTDGTWEYLPEAQSILIDYGDKKKLYRHQYLDEAVLALKPDGFISEKDFFLLANEKAIPDLNVENYLKSKFLQEQNINLVILDDGKEIEIYNDQNSNQVEINSIATIGGVSIKDGEYYYNSGASKLIIHNGVISDIKRRVNLGENIYGWITHQIPVKGDKIEGIKNGSIEFEINNGEKYLVSVRDGDVYKVEQDTLMAIETVVVVLVIFFTLAWIASMIFD